jgi:hypothetical protein
VDKGEKSDADLEKKEIATEIKELEKQKKALENHVSNLTTPVNLAKAALNKEEDDFPTGDCWVCAKLEQIYLRQYGVDRAAHHGGDLTGGCVKRMMSNAKELFGEMSGYLDGVAEDNGVSEEIREEMRMRLDLYSTCLQQFDGFFSRLRIRKGEVKDLDVLVEETKTYLNAAMGSWRQLKLSVTPKLHLLEVHAIPFLKRLGGLGDFDEEFVERCHQIGVRGNLRNRSSNRDAVRKYINLSRWEHAALNPVVTKIKKEVAEQRKRKRKPTGQQSTREVKKANRQSHRTQSIQDAGTYLDDDIRTATEINIERSNNGYT